MAADCFSPMLINYTTLAASMTFMFNSTTFYSSLSRWDTNMDLQANNFGANCKYSKQTQVASLSGGSTTLFWLELWYERDPECSTPS